MRLLYFVSTLSGGGAENGLLTLIDRGLFMGFDLTVVALARGDGAIESRLGDRIGRERVILLTEDAIVSKHTLLVALLCYPKILKRTDPGVVVLALEHANFVGRFWSPLVKSCVVSFEHSVKYGSRAVGRLLRLLSLRIDVVIADSQVTLDHITAHYYRKGAGKRRFVLPPYVRAADLKIQKYKYASGSAFKLAIAGRLVGVKNHAVLIEAIARLQRVHGLRCSLEIYGDGPMRGELEDLVRRLDLSADVRFEGFREDWLVSAVEVDLYVQPSAWEGLCITVLEAMSVGLPVIASPVGEIPNYASHLENAYFISEVTAEQIATAIHVLATQPDIRERIGKRAALDVDEKYGEHSFGVSRNAVRDALKRRWR